MDRRNIKSERRNRAEGKQHYRKRPESREGAASQSGRNEASVRREIWAAVDRELDVHFEKKSGKSNFLFNQFSERKGQRIVRLLLLSR